ncbi:MAG TPA: proton-conducting transporter membrane subunit [Pirellulales bacterium]|jgi:hydrogenase-4 component B|nr:proton-conducting transporter membrane subunit [Pirellulales bacterium]
MESLIRSIAGLAISGAVGALFGRRSAWGQWLSTAIAAASAVYGIAAVVRWYAAGSVEDWQRSWALVPQGLADGQLQFVGFHVGLDGVSAVFILPIFLVALLGPIYGQGYWRQSENPDTGRRLRLFYGLCVAGMALLVVARNTIVFLFGWEVMAISAFMLVATEDDKPAVREAAWTYLVATHAATLTLFGLFAALRAITGSFDWPNREPFTAAQANVVFLLAVLGFGLKAGIMPLHVWLPGAHANAPSHVSALMSGVLIKMGVYGLVRVCSFLPQPPLWWGGLLLALGVTSGVLALAIAVAQQDFKRLLAYSSVENVGIIFIGLGVALLGRSMGRAEWVAMGLAGALWHVWNHAVFKSLLFYCAGSIVHATHTRQINLLGGLARGMPMTTLAFAVAAAAVCGLPPLNGFVSEFLIYLGLFSMLGVGQSPGESQTLLGGSLAAPGLALIGAMAVACYASAFGAIFLGAPRSEHATQAHEAERTMLLPMGLLMAACAALGLFPHLAAPAFDRAVTAWSSAPLGGEALVDSLTPIASFAPLGWLSVLGFLLVGLGLAGGAALWTRLRPDVTSTSVTWGCGYLAATPRMQYTSTSFSELLVALFRWVVRPSVEAATIQPHDLFPQAAAYRTEAPDSVLERVVVPALRWLGGRLLFFRIFQQGSLQAYLFYILAIVVTLLAWPY